MKRKFLWATVVSLTFFLLLIGALLLMLHKKGLFTYPDLTRLEDPRQSSIVYDEDGTALKEFCTYCREVISLNEMGVFPKVAVAAEDRHFWSFWRKRSAVDLLAIPRCLWKNFEARRVVQGCSTITQQVARIIFEEEELQRERETKKLSDQSWRKIREVYLATILQWRLQPERILELYLNTIYCGSGRYGVKSCSRFYFEKDPQDITRDEAAMIVGLFRSPTLSPFTRPHEARELRSRVLEQLLRGRVITSDDKTVLEKKSLPERQTKDGCVSAPHFTEFIRRQIVAENRFVDQGLKVHTALVSSWQQAACQGLRQTLNEMKKRNPELQSDLWGSALVMDLRNGQIKVWVQEPSFKENEFLLDQIVRHTGSAFKPFFYAAWIEKGGCLSEGDEGCNYYLLDDSYSMRGGKSGLYIPMGAGRPRHYLQNFPYEGLPRYIGLAPALRMITESRNVGTESGVYGVYGSRVPAGQRIHKEELMALAMRLGINFPVMDPDTARQNGIALIGPNSWGIPVNSVDPGLTLAIGSVDVSLLQMVQALAALVSGILVDPYAVEEVYDSSGKLLKIAKTETPNEVLDEYVRLSVLRGLRATVELPHGTGSRAKKELPFQVCGKTGTATNYGGETTDNWFIGCTPHYVMGIWIGREKKLLLKTTIQNGKKIQETGGRNALPVFIATMKTIYKEMEPESFPEVTSPQRPFRPSDYPEPEAEDDDLPLPENENNNAY